MKSFKNFSQAKIFLEARRARYFPGEAGRKRTQMLLKLLGNPQEKIKIIHIAGTSGKGSTAYLISQMLNNLGFKTGLTLSPHFEDIRERIQINNHPISQKKFVFYLHQLLPWIEKLATSPWGPATYFEILTALAFYTFNKEKVDYAVIETGLGGQDDATNTIKNPQKIAVLTRIGLDHTRILGKTKPKIAAKKAAIIQPKNTVIALKQSPAIDKVFIKTARQKKAHLHFIEKKRHFKNIQVGSKQTIFDFSFSSLKISQIKLGLLGKHQAENASLALATIFFLGKRDHFPIPLTNIRKILAKAHFPGRMEIFKLDSRYLIVDGAHNPQKIKALISSLKDIFPQQKFTFLLAFKKTKNINACLKPLLPQAEKIFITDFPGPAQKPSLIRKCLKKMGFPEEKITIIQNPQRIINKRGNSPLVITGSFYLLRRLRDQIKKKPS